MPCGESTKLSPGGNWCRLIPLVSEVPICRIVLRSISFSCCSETYGATNLLGATRTGCLRQYRTERCPWLSNRFGPAASPVNCRAPVSVAHQQDSSQRPTSSLSNGRTDWLETTGCCLASIAAAEGMHSLLAGSSSRLDG